MKEDRSLVRASDIGLWSYCHRAWWLAKVKQAPHNNPARLEAGSAAHAAHGTTVARARTLQQLGVALIGLAVLAAGITLIWWLLA